MNKKAFLILNLLTLFNCIALKTPTENVMLDKQDANLQKFSPHAAGGVIDFEAFVVEKIKHRALQLNAKLNEEIIEWDQVKTLRSNGDTPSLEFLMQQYPVLQAAVGTTTLIIDIDSTLLEPATPFYSHSTFGIFYRPGCPKFDDFIGDLISKNKELMSILEKDVSDKIFDKEGKLSKEFMTFLYTAGCIKVPSRATEDYWIDLMSKLLSCGIDVRIVSAVEHFYGPKLRWKQLESVGFHLPKMTNLTNAYVEHETAIKDKNGVIQAITSGILTHLSKTEDKPNKGNILSVFPNLQSLKNKQVICVDDEPKNLECMFKAFKELKDNQVNYYSYQYTVSREKKVIEQYDIRLSNRYGKTDVNYSLRDAHDSVMQVFGSKGKDDIKNWTDDEISLFIEKAKDFWKVFLPEIISDYVKKIKKISPKTSPRSSQKSSSSERGNSDNESTSSSNSHMSDEHTDVNLNKNEITHSDNKMFEGKAAPTPTKTLASIYSNLEDIEGLNNTAEGSQSDLGSPQNKPATSAPTPINPPISLSNNLESKEVTNKYENIHSDNKMTETDNEEQYENSQTYLEGLTNNFDKKELSLNNVEDIDDNSGQKSTLSDKDFNTDDNTSGMTSENFNGSATVTPTNTSNHSATMTREHSNSSAIVTPTNASNYSGITTSENSTISSVDSPALNRSVNTVNAQDIKN